MSRSYAISNSVALSTHSLKEWLFIETGFHLILYTIKQQPNKYEAKQYKVMRLRSYNVDLRIIISGKTHATTLPKESIEGTG